MGEIDDLLSASTRVLNQLSEKQHLNLIMAYKTTASLIWVIMAALFFHPQAWADEDLRLPKGRVILTISGNITKTNSDGKAEFDFDMLQALETHTVSTTTSWTDGTQNFSGVAMRDLMETVGARGKTVEAVALNDYIYAIDIEDFSLYPVILATKLNGEILKVRDKGPLWIIYPLDSFSDVEKSSIERRMVWQLRQLTVK